MAAKKMAKKISGRGKKRVEDSVETPGVPGAGSTLVIVESPTKARTIRKFLDKGYVVESCMGHVRDLPQSAKEIPEKFRKLPWATLGVDTENGFEPIYCVPKTKSKVVSALKEKLKNADQLLLATDEDREGESISWHLLEVLKPRIPFKRMVFNEITKDAIQKALTETRDIDKNLVHAQEARRILDRLVGYTLSPLLWKKIAFGLSAGRVQSVAVRLIVEREQERLRFHRARYFGIEAQHSHAGIPFQSKILTLNGKKIAVGRDFDPNTGKLLAERSADYLLLEEAAAQALEKSLRGKTWIVSDVEEKPVSRKPPAPFITSTLQQEANRKLGLSAREAMQVAQNLYEQGYITYMRTDSTFLSQQALEAARGKIVELYGRDYLPEAPRTYEHKKAKGAQEAHEAIRPAGAEMALPEETGLTGLPFKLYDLIWKRTMASQMVNSRQRQVSVKFDVEQTTFGASGMTIEFPGFLRAYVEGLDDEAAALDEREVRLPALELKQRLAAEKVSATAHETKPPARFTEATLVQTMEREGIGRPSTYASIIGTIVDRGYVQKTGNALVPTFTAMAVAQLLSRHLTEYVDLQFTSSMEESLDLIASGELNSTSYLTGLYSGKEGLKAKVDEREKSIDPTQAREIQLNQLKDLSFRVGRYGAYVCRKEAGNEVCATLPDALAPADLTAEVAHQLIDQKKAGADALAHHPKTGEPIFVLSGRYGPYVQLGESEGEDAKPKRVSLPTGMDPATVSVAQAVQLLELPKTVGVHPDSGKEIKVGLGRFGPYVVHEKDFRSIPKGESLFEVSLERALELLAKPKFGRGAATPLKILGTPAGSEDPIQLFEGRYGPYVKQGEVIASLPEEISKDVVTLEQAVKLLDERRSQEPKQRSRRPKSKRK